MNNLEKKIDLSKSTEKPVKVSVAFDRKTYLTVFFATISIVIGVVGGFLYSLRKIWNNFIFVEVEK